MRASRVSNKNIFHPPAASVDMLRKFTSNIFKMYENIENKNHEWESKKIKLESVTS